MVEIRNRKNRSGYPKMSPWVCIRLGEELKRVKRSKAAELVSSGAAVYVPRSVWKEEVRDATQGNRKSIKSKGKKSRK